MAPAMHTEMWTHPATVANVATLRVAGRRRSMDPAVGRLTGADSGPGGCPTPSTSRRWPTCCCRDPAALPRDLAGRRIVVSAGGTREPLDPVRYLGNRSSGRQGYALALVAAARGAEVTLVSANVSLAAPAGGGRRAGRRRPRPGAAMKQASRRRRRGRDGGGGRRLPAGRGRRHEDQEAGRVRSRSRCTLVKNPDILAGIAAPGPDRPPVVVGFAAETGDEHGSVAGLRQGQAGPQGLRPAGGQPGRRRPRVRSGRQRRSHPVRRRIGARCEIPFGPKTVLAAAVCDAIAARLDPTPPERPAMTGIRRRRPRKVVAPIRAPKHASLRTTTHRTPTTAAHDVGARSRDLPPFHLRVRDRGPSRQDLRRDQRRDPGRTAPAGSRPAGLRWRRW